MRGWDSSSITALIIMFAHALTRPLATSALVSTSRRSSRSLSVALAASAPTSTTKYWNREESMPRTFSSTKPVVKQAKIVSLSLADDPANAPLHQGALPEGSSLLAVGTNIAELDIERLKQEEPNVLFVSHAQVRHVKYMLEWYLMTVIFLKFGYFFLTVYFFIGSKTIGRTTESLAID